MSAAGVFFAQNNREELPMPTRLQASRKRRISPDLLADLAVLFVIGLVLLASFR